MLPSFIGPQAPRRAIWQRVSALLISYTTLYIFNLLQFEYACVHASKLEERYAVPDLCIYICRQTLQTSKRSVFKFINRVYKNVHSPHSGAVTTHKKYSNHS